MTAPIHSTSGTTGIGLDVGQKRIGVARANLSVRFAGPLTTLEQPDQFVADILNLCRIEDAAWMVLGLPRGLDGQETAQTQWVRDFGAELTTALSEAQLEIPLYWIDEALTSSKAEQELNARGKLYGKAEIDALAATYILDDFLQQHTEKGV